MIIQDELLNPYYIKTERGNIEIRKYKTHIKKEFKDVPAHELPEGSTYTTDIFFKMCTSIDSAISAIVKDRMANAKKKEKGSVVMLSEYLRMYNEECSKLKKLFSGTDI